MVTAIMLGAFLTDPALKKEFYDILKLSRTQ